MCEQSRYPRRFHRAKALATASPKTINEYTRPAQRGAAASLPPEPQEAITMATVKPTEISDRQQRMRRKRASEFRTRAERIALIPLALSLFGDFFGFPVALNVALPLLFVAIGLAGMAREYAVMARSRG